MKLNYRADIDGLRAIAVLAVVFNHAGISLFSGGFVGVDVFFVISGYLITGIILREINAGEFSLVQFYERRIRRIYPALFATLLFTAIVAAFFYDAQTFQDYGKSVMATALFVSNIYFWTQTGYFAGDNQLKPLLHTWSLAIEEQFYIIFPLLMLGLTRYAKSATSYVLLGVALLSFGWDVYALGDDASGAFYFAHLRAWELLIGSLLALNLFRVKAPAPLRSALAFIGLGAICAPIFLYSENIAFPGIAAAAPALGTALVIYSGIENFTFVNKALSLSPLVFVGKISYSLYLLHLPLIDFASYYAIKKLSRPELLFLLAAIFILSALSWRFIEKPFRAPSSVRRTKVFWSAGGLMALVAFGGFFIDINDGFPKQRDQTQTPQKWVYEDCYADPRNANKTLILCPLGEPTQLPSFLLWGDSHASALAQGVHKSALSQNAAGLLAVGDGCPPLLGITADKKSPCVNFNDQTLEYVANHPEIQTVILVGRWAKWAEGVGYKDTKKIKLIDAWAESSKAKTNAALFEIGLNRLVEKLLKLNHRVIIVTQTPEVKFYVTAANAVAQRTGRDLNDAIAPSLTDYLNRNEKALYVVNALRKRYNIQVIDPYKALCDSTRCLVKVGDALLYTDDNHLSIFGSEYISYIYDPLFQEITNAQKETP